MDTLEEMSRIDLPELNESGSCLVGHILRQALRPASQKIFNFGNVCPVGVLRQGSRFTKATTSKARG
jgi:hypothetical protein